LNILSATYLIEDFLSTFQVSYMIVDDADVEIEMSEDPFLEAGITAPPILPYQDEHQLGESTRLVLVSNYN
jgi:hypothetical protein